MADEYDVPPPDYLRGLGYTVYVIAALGLVGSVIAGIDLITYSVPQCNTNPFDSSLTDCTASSHPFLGVGWSVLLGGCAQAIVLSIVGRLATVTSSLRAAMRAVLKRSDLPMAGSE